MVTRRKFLYATAAAVAAAAGPHSLSRSIGRHRERDALGGGAAAACCGDSTQCTFRSRADRRSRPGLSIS